MTSRQFHLPLIVLLPALALVAMLGAACSPAAAALAPASDATPPALFAETNQKPSLSASNEKAVVRSRYVSVNISLVRTAAGPEAVKRLTLNLFPDVSVTAVLDRVDRPSATGFVWVGHVDGVQGSQVTLSVQDDVMVGTIILPDKQYQVRFAGNGVHAVNQINQAAFGPD